MSGILASDTRSVPPAERQEERSDCDDGEKDVVILVAQVSFVTVMQYGSLYAFSVTFVSSWWLEESDDSVKILMF